MDTSSPSHGVWCLLVLFGTCCCSQPFFQCSPPAWASLFENGLDIYCTYVPWSKDSVWGDVHPSLGFHQSGYFFVHQPLLIGNHPPSIPNRDSIKWVYYMVKQSPINVLIVTHKSRCQGFTLGDVLHLRCFRQPSPRNLSKFSPPQATHWTSLSCPFGGSDSASPGTFCWCKHERRRPTRVCWRRLRWADDKWCKVCDLKIRF